MEYVQVHQVHEYETVRNKKGGNGHKDEVRGGEWAGKGRKCVWGGVFWLRLCFKPLKARMNVEGD